jgi:hypothetical protein
MIYYSSMQIGLFVTVLKKNLKNIVWHAICNVLSVMNIAIVTSG